jgi:hypothetical protein
MNKNILFWSSYKRYHSLQKLTKFQSTYLTYPSRRIGDRMNIYLQKRRDNPTTDLQNSVLEFINDRWW